MYVNLFIEKIPWLTLHCFIPLLVLITSKLAYFYKIIINHGSIVLNYIWAFFLKSIKWIMINEAIDNDWQDSVG